MPINPKAFELILKIAVEAGKMVLDACVEKKSGSSGKKSTARKTKPKS